MSRFVTAAQSRHMSDAWSRLADELSAAIASTPVVDTGLAALLLVRATQHAAAPVTINAVLRGVARRIICELRDGTQRDMWGVDSTAGAHSTRVPPQWR